MPSVALISAMPLPARFGGSTVPTRLMPTGIAATDSPTTARPAIITPISLVNAQISEPATKVTSVTSSMSRLPYRSPRRPKTGTATAPTSSVEVSSHSVAVAEACRSSASCGRTGTSSDWVSETSSPATATSASVAVALLVPPASALPETVRAVAASWSPLRGP